MNKEYLKQKSLNILNRIKTEIVKVSKGEANFNVMLYAWGLLPALLIMFFFQRMINSISNVVIALVVYFVLTLYFLWHMFCIRKTLKVQPEHRVVKISKKELYKDKTKEEINEIKKEKRKERLEKLLLLRGWDTTPNYILVGCIDAYVALTQLQAIFTIIKY